MLNCIFVVLALGIAVIIFGTVESRKRQSGPVTPGQMPSDLR